MLDMFLSTEGIVALITLSAMEIVLGIDNIIFIAILVGRLPEKDRARTRTLGLFFALFTRIALLFSLSWIMGLTEPFFHLMGRGVSGRDLILLGGGLFLIGKSTVEIHHKVEGESEKEALQKTSKQHGLAWMILQIMILDIVFSLDSVITAVGMVSQVPIMVAAMIIAMIIMIISSGAISGFVERHPSIKILALSFLLLIGVMLVAESAGQHIEKGYIYFAMFFSLGVELLNMRYRGKNH